MFVCVFGFLLVCASVCLSVQFSFRLCVCLFVCLLGFLLVCASVCVCVGVSFSVYVCLSVCLWLNCLICLFVAALWTVCSCLTPFRSGILNSVNNLNHGRD